MQIGYLYIISNPLFEKDVYKLGYSYDNKKKLEHRYNTYYVENIIIHNTYLVIDKKLAEKLLFHKLRKYRIKSNREFFRCTLEIMTKTCEEIVNIINDSNKNDINNDILLINKYKKSINNKIYKDLEIKIKKEDEKNKLHDNFKNTIIEFIKSECVIDENMIIKSSTLYTNFKIWNKNNQDIDIKFFSPIIIELGYLKIKTVAGFFFTGINLKLNKKDTDIDKLALIKKFIDKYFNNDPFSFTYVQDFQNKFKLDYGNKINKNTLQKLLKDIGYIKSRKSDGRGFMGIKLKENLLDK